MNRVKRLPGRLEGVLVGQNMKCYQILPPTKYGDRNEWLYKTEETRKLSLEGPKIHARRCVVTIARVSNRRGSALRGT